MKPLRILVALIVFSGASLTARAMYLDTKAELASVLIHRAWVKTAAQGTPHAPWPWADTHPVARLCIPRLGYDEIVLEGATPRTLLVLRSSSAEPAWANPAMWNWPGIAQAGFGLSRPCKQATKFKFSGLTLGSTNFASALIL